MIRLLSAHNWMFTQERTYLSICACTVQTEEFQTRHFDIFPTVIYLADFVQI